MEDRHPNSQLQYCRMFTSSLTIFIIITTCYGFALVICASNNGNSLERPRQPVDPSEQPQQQAKAPADEQQAIAANSDPSSGGPKTPPLSKIKNITAQNGQTILLSCSWQVSGDSVVAWFRGSGNLELLTLDTKTVISDDKFKVLSGISTSGAHMSDWALQVKHIDKSTDSGLYECQLNSDPPQSQYYLVNIVEPQVTILGGPDATLRLGDPMNLTCIITQSPDQFQFIFWFKDGKVINFDLDPNRAKIVISKEPNKPDITTSNLLIFSSTLTDSANYTCQPSGVQSTSIFVHVLRDNSDGRLISFQNDNYHELSLSATSSLQTTGVTTTNSAISAKTVKLSSSRLLAVSIALVILQTWFHLVSQLQTGISLLLLAVIGWFIAKFTELNGIKARDEELSFGVTN